MTDTPGERKIFATVSMGEILLAQNMVAEARRVVEALLESEPDNARVTALRDRLEEVARGEAPRPLAQTAQGLDKIVLSTKENAVQIAFELTDRAVALARRTARYSGRPVVRIFTAAPGPRGVRTMTRDLDIAPGAAVFTLLGLQRPAVHVAAVGYLANTGLFIAMAQTEAPLVMS